MKKMLFFVICFISIYSCKSEIDSYMSPEVAEIEQLVVKQKELFEAPGIALGVIKNDTIVYAKTHGVKNLKTQETLTTESIFHMASVSKPFVATAIVQLVEKGQIDLDEKLTYYLPYFSMNDNRYKDITIRHMLNHTSGIPDVDDYNWDKPEYDDGAAERFSRSQQSVKLDFSPGEQYNYSNAAFDILCDVISKVSGMTFEAYMKTYIFEPVGMKHSTFFKPEVDKSLATSPHVFGDDLQKEVSTIYPYNRKHAGSSTLHSNVEDMLLWAKVNLNKGIINGNRIYSEESYKLLTTGQTPERQRKVGLSWFIAKLNDSKLNYHSGGDPGYSTFFAFMPEKKAAIVMMVNTDNFWSEDNSAIILSNLIFDTSYNPVVPIHFKLKNYILTDGIDKVKEVYHFEDEKESSDYEFDNGFIDDLGYWLMDRNKFNKALDVFLFNTELEPDHAGWVDSVGDAYKAMDSIDLAIKWYKKALEIDSDQDFSMNKLKALLENR